MFGWGVKTVTVAELEEKLRERKRVLIDVREPHEYASGHIKGSRSIPLRQLGSKIGKLDRGEEVFLVCHSGYRSNRAAKIVRKAGFDAVYSVKGGTRAWGGRLVR